MRRWNWPKALQPPRDQRAERERPAPDRLRADVDPALRLALFDVAKTEAETEVEPVGMADDLRREPMAD